MFKVLLILLLSALSTTAFAHGMSAEDQARILNAGYFEYMQLGATHMLSGYDHLLFLFGVIFFLTRFNDILKFITAFTVGHSITLVFATLFEIKANYYLIDAVIALTVCYKAFDNLDGFKKYFQMSSPNLTWMVFVFGLIHGFGLSTRLQQLPLGDQGIVIKILSFNVGVELGQIIALSIMLLLLAGWRKMESFKQFSKASNIALMFAGGFLLLMQLHGYQHSQYPDDFPLNSDDHHHIHEDMANQASPLTNYPIKLNLNTTTKQKAPTKNADTPPDTHSHDGKHVHSH
jgi:hydrogenase/urease accessory protein HupE